MVYHKRLRPAEHVLKYRVFSLLVALDEIEQLSDKFWLFSYNRWNLISFFDKDFGDGSGGSLQAYVLQKLSENGISVQPARILLSCYPRVLGYSFNPISLFYCLDEQNRPIAILHEVHNTFGERHTYVLAVDNQAQCSDGWINQSSDKVLFVSPFAHMNMRYTFRLNVPGEKQVLVIRAFDEIGQLLTASYTAKQVKLTSTNLLRYFCGIPLLSVKVIAGIHYEALKLWLKKVPLFAHVPKQPLVPPAASNELKNQ